MHIPDGFLDAKTAAASGLLAAAGLGMALRSIHRTMPARKIPLLGLAASFVFVAQMLNFPVGAGTSGHLIGAVLAAVLLGPAAAVLVMTSVLILQCFLFQDGGVTALGANIFNMAIVAPVVGYGSLRVRLAPAGRRNSLPSPRHGFRLLVLDRRRVHRLRRPARLFGDCAFSAAFPAMTGIHMVIGIGEAVITTLVISAIARLRPELLAGRDAPPPTRYADLLVQGLLVSLGLAVFVAPFASAWPDGLEKVASALGFERRAAEQPPISSPFSDYAIPGMSSSVLSTIIAGCIGTVAAFLLAWLLASFLTPRPSPDNLAGKSGAP